MAGRAHDERKRSWAQPALLVVRSDHLPRGRVFLRADRVAEQDLGAAVDFELEHGPGDLVDVDVGDDELFLFQLGLGNDQAAGGEDQRTAVLLLVVADVAGGEPDRVLHGGRGGRGIFAKKWAAGAKPLVCTGVTM
jgi:hypothetical protein